MRLFAQLSWYFRREWQRYLGAVALLIIIAILQLIPPKVVGYVVDGVTEQHYTTARVLMWVGTLVLTAVIVYLLRYVWRVLLFGASYQLAVELREDFYRQLSRQHPEFYLRHRTGDLIARATNDVDRVVFAAGEGVLALVDSLVMGCAVLIVIQMKGVHTFAPNWSTQPAFGRALAAAQAAGVRLIAMDCRVAPDRMTIDQPVPIDLTPPPGLSL